MRDGVEAGGLLGPGARASWRVAVAGAPAAIARWVKAREADRSPGARVETGDDLSPQLRAALASAGSARSAAFGCSGDRQPTRRNGQHRVAGGRSAMEPCNPPGIRPSLLGKPQWTGVITE